MFRLTMTWDLPTNFGFSGYVETIPPLIWKQNNVFPTPVPPIYPANGDLSARNISNPTVIPFDKTENYAIYSLYLFPKDVRNAYEQRAQKINETFINNPNTPERDRACYVYNGDTLCVPYWEKPYFYYIQTKEISVLEFYEFCKTTENMEIESIANLTPRHKADFEKWALFYEEKSSGTKISFEMDTTNFKHTIRHYYTDSTIEFISHLDKIKFIRLTFWDPVFTLNKTLGIRI